MSASLQLFMPPCLTPGGWVVLSFVRVRYIGWGIIQLNITGRTTLIVVEFERAVHIHTGNSLSTSIVSATVCASAVYLMTVLDFVLWSCVTYLV